MPQPFFLQTPAKVKVLAKAGLFPPFLTTPSPATPRDRAGVRVLLPGQNPLSTPPARVFSFLAPWQYDKNKEEAQSYDRQDSYRPGGDRRVL